MIPPFDFATSSRILFGRGQLKQLAETASALAGRGRALLVTGSGALERAGVLDAVEADLAAGGVEARRFEVAGEPRVKTVDAGVRVARESGCALVIGIGGGSVLDAAKAIAAVTTNGGSVLEYLEGVGAGRAIEKPGLPCIAVPTTAGTGAEVTRNAVIGSDEGGFKKSIRGFHLTPAVALVDPALTDSCPPALTASCGLDALTQLIESYTSTSATPFTDALALDGIRRAAVGLPRACANGRDEAARDETALAALESGICLANAGLGAVHGLAAPLGGRFPVPHGTACAILLPRVIEMNLRRARAEGASQVTARYEGIARAVGRTDGGVGLVAWLADFSASMQTPALASFGVRRESIPDIVEAARGRSMRFNPFVLTDDELAEVLAHSL